MLMKYRALCILAAIALCLCLFSCGSQPEETNTTGEITAAETSTATTTTIPTTAAPEPQPWYEAIKEYAFDCLIDEQGNFYYNDEQGIWRYKADELEAECIIPEGKLCSIDKNYLYYVTASRNIMRAPLDDPEKDETLVTAQQLGIDDDWFLEDFQYYLRRIELHNNILFLQWHARKLLAYDLNKKRVFELSYAVASYVIHKGYVYFSGWRDFRFYRVPLRSLGQKPEPAIDEYGERGNEGRIFYDWFQTSNGHLYFVQRPPETIWRYDENGNHELFYDFSEGRGGGNFCRFIDDKLYFERASIISAAPCRVLYCYDPKTGKTTVACDDEDFSNSFGSDVRILRDRVFFTKHTSESDPYEYEILSAPLK